MAYQDSPSIPRSGEVFQGPEKVSLHEYVRDELYRRTPLIKKLLTDSKLSRISG